MNSKVKRILAGLSTIILIIIMVIFVDINTIINELHKISFYGLFFFILIYTGVFVMRTIRLKLIFQALNLNVSYLTLYGSYGIGWGINELTPGKIGDLVRIEAIRQKESNISLSKSLCGIGIERVIDLLLLFSITCIALIFMYLLNIQGTSSLNLSFYVGICGILLLGGTLILIILFIKTDWILNGLGKISPKLQYLIEGFLRNFLEGINDFRKNKKKVIEVFLLSMPTWMLETLTLVSFFYLTGYSVNIFIIIVAQVIVFFTKTFPITPGGWVISENAGALLIFLFFPSIEYQYILGIVVLDHVIRTGYILIFGIISSLLLNFKFKSIDLDYSKEIHKKRNLENVTRGYGLLEKFFSIQRMKKAQKLIKKHDKKGKILDIGCGIYPYFLMNTKFESKFGIDQGIENKTIKKNNIFLKNYNICKELDIPFEKESFDVITMLAVIEHLDKNQASEILKKCYLMLKKDGILIITTPAHWSEIILKIFAKLHVVSPEEISEHKILFSMKELNSLLLNSNFKLSNIQKGYFEFFLNMWICGKK